MCWWFISDTFTAASISHTKVPPLVFPTSPPPAARTACVGGDPTRMPETEIEREKLTNLWEFSAIAWTATVTSLLPWLWITNEFLRHRFYNALCIPAVNYFNWYHFSFPSPWADASHSFSDQSGPWSLCCHSGGLAVTDSSQVEVNNVIILET